MGELIILAERIARRSRAAVGARPAFFFHLACPFSYLAAEQVERTLGEVEWIPTAGPVPTMLSRSLRAQAERHASELRMPLVWPERFPPASRSALRAATYAAGIGAGAPFALAASRLAFCGGFDVDDPEILAEAAAAAAVPLDGCLAAARDPALDLPAQAAARSLLACGVRRLAVVQVGERMFEGERAPLQAAALLRAQDARTTYPAWVMRSRPRDAR